MEIKLLNSQRRFIAIAIILIGTSILYSPLVKFDFTNWDDDEYILNSELVKSGDVVNAFTEFTVGLYTPIVSMSYMLDYKLFGLESSYYHLENLLLHLLVCILIYALSLYLFKDEIVAILTTALFAIHPLHVEPVAWISSRKDLLFTIFYLIALLFYFKYRQVRKNSFLFISLFLIIFSCLSKPSAVSFPLVLTAYLILMEGEKSIKKYLHLIPFYLISLIFGIITLIGASQLDLRVQADKGYNFFESLMLGTYSLPFYFVKSIIPIGLVNYYPYPTPGEEFPLLFKLSPILLIGIIIFCVVMYKKNKQLLFLFLFSVLIVLPVIRISPMGFPMVADRYFYLASFGILAIPAFMYCHYQSWQRWVLYPGIVLLLIYSVISHKQLKIWENSRTLWTHAINKYPDFYYSYRERGRFYYMIGQKERALQDYNRALQLNSQDVNLLTEVANLEIELGYQRNVLELQNQAIEKNGDAGTYYNRGNTYKAKNEFELAIQDYNKALEMDSGFAQAYNNRGICYVMLNDTSSAFKDFKMAHKLKPQNKMFEDNYLRLKNMVSD